MEKANTNLMNVNKLTTRVTTHLLRVIQFLGFSESLGPSQVMVGGTESDEENEDGRVFSSVDAEEGETYPSVPFSGSRAIVEDAGRVLSLSIFVTVMKL